MSCGKVYSHFPTPTDAQHGRVKVKSSAEQQEAQKKERARRLEVYRNVAKSVLQKRKDRQFDQQALDLTGQILSSNPDQGSFWNFRREIFLALEQEKSESELQDLYQTELSFLEGCLRVNPKSYGTWHHRCWVMDRQRSPDWARELELCAQCLQQDERNFHCWDYRRFVALRGSVPPEDELDFTHRLISSNFSNYSSWHYRSKLLPLVWPDPEGKGLVSEEALLREYRLVQNAFFTDPNDQSAWFYHRWLLGRAERPESLSCLYADFIEQRLVVVFSRPVHVAPGEIRLSLRVDNRPVSGDWTPADGHNTYCSVWLCELPGERWTLSSRIRQFVSPGARSTRAKSANCLDRVRGEGWCQDSATDGQLFQNDLSVQKATVLEAELKSCKQLQELEPQNKWCLLTIVLLLRALDPLGSEQETLTYFQRLAQADPIRAAYFADLRSHFLVQNAILKMEYAEARVIDLAHKDLTTLCHLDQLLLVTHLDLSGNRLRRLPSAFRALQCLQVLQADGNEIEKIEGLSKLPKLEEVSLRENRLGELDDLQPLTSCPRLRSLLLTGNPLCLGAEAGSHVRSLLPGPDNILT
ncbi:LOW QUALITY PROTEIN: geranylgeranyl transferase type-2 subunit alpha [Narcine bancroftii]|uniref:LOW QUALITY PROTEIN: geranylgeranyl transferase type-2 subunit alpha n=1 Tax=Narcine bancroftii TaxID=1343680 RepID=UPI003831A6BA